MKTIYQLQVGKQTFFAINIQEEGVSVVFQTLESAIRGTEEPFGILTDDGEITKDGEILGSVDGEKEIDEELIRKVAKMIGEEVE